MNQEKELFTENFITRKKWVSALLILLICLVASILYYRLVFVIASVEIEIEVPQKTDLRVFWTEDGGHYSEHRMARVVIYPGKASYALRLTDLRQVDSLRIDPFAYAGKAIVKAVSFRQQGIEDIELSDEQLLQSLQPVNQIDEYHLGDRGIEISSSGNDPYFEIEVQLQQKELDWGRLIRICTLICAIITIVSYWGNRLVVQFRFVPLLLFGVWLLIIAMAGISKKNAHPDEYVHMYATSYYQDNWLPPVVDNPEIRNSYSVYGVSRLNAREIFYVAAGKFEHLIEDLQLPTSLSKRLFNVILFGLIVLYTIHNRRARLVAVPLLLSSQIWYVFSYCNSDALGITVAFFAACQLVDSDSLLQRYLKGAGWGVNLAGILVTSTLIGVMFLLKKNYYPFAAFFFFCVFVKLFFTAEYYWERKQALFRFLLVTLLGLSLFGLRVGLDYQVNGVDRLEKIGALQEELAHYGYKPSTPLEEKNSSIKRMERGTSFKDLFYKLHWGEKTFQSSFGVFGYFTIAAPKQYYTLVRNCSILLCAFVFGSILVRGGLLEATTVVAALGVSLALVGVSAYLSWTVDFQPQGRYLFPVAAVLSIAYGLYDRLVNVQILSLGVMSLYILACYSFIFYGLMLIPKMAG